jgi:hypothetical protein
MRMGVVSMTVVTVAVVSMVVGVGVVTMMAVVSMMAMVSVVVGVGVVSMMAVISVVMGELKLAQHVNSAEKLIIMLKHVSV